MNNDQQDINNPHGHPLSHHFNLGTTLQNVFRNINHAFANSHNPSTEQQGDSDSRDDVPSIDRPLNSVGGTPDSSPAALVPSVPAVPPLADVDVSQNSQLDSTRDEDEESMPDLESITYSEDESDASVDGSDPGPSHQDTPIADHEGVRMGDEATAPPIPPVTGTRRARVDDDGDDDRDRRHPSERVGGLPPLRNTAPQNAEPQQPPRLPTGLFAPLFGLGPSGGNQPAGNAPPERVHTGEATADLSSAGNNPSPGHPPRGVPILIAGFTLTIPLFGPPPGNGTGPAPGPQAGAGAGPQGMFGMDPAAREELLASFSAFFQEFQAAEEAREDPERAKKLMAGLDIVPTGLVKRLERVGGAPGGHIGESTNEGTSGCAICWDTLLDAEGDSFSGQHSSECGAPPPSSLHAEGQARMEGQAMEVDAPPVPDSQSASASNPSSTEEEVKIIALPCAHVFHASCLVPWFTRAKQATCPTCRFNIDPENLTYTPQPRRPFTRAGPVRPDIPVPNATPANPQAGPEAPSEPLPAGTRTTAVPPVNTAHLNAGAHPATAPVPPGNTTPPTAGQAGTQPPGMGFNPFLVGIPIMSFPAIQIPLRQPEAQTPGGGNQDAGVDVLTIGLDMFVGGPPPQERGDRRDNAETADGAANANGEPATGAAGGNGAPNPNGLAPDVQSFIENLLRTTRNIIPQVINGQGGPIPQAAGPGAPHANGFPPEPPSQARPAPAPGAAGPQPVPPTGGPRAFPTFPFIPNMFRAPYPMPPRREPKTWTVPAAPGPSLRQRVEQREREQGLRCSDTSCGIGPCDDDPCPDPCASLTKQVAIHPLPCHYNHENNERDGFVCSHAFHPACLVSAERVAGWGGEDKTKPLVEVSCPVCRAVGCVTREEWELGVSEL